MNGEPIVLIGRGGSGTRLLSQIALANGVFLGNDLNVSSDSSEWVDCIYALAIESLETGIAANSTRDFFWQDRLQQNAATILERAGVPERAPWGWKLPETLLGLAQVLRTFPRAKIAHLVRDPVTSSLRRTHLTSRNDNIIGRPVLASAYDACGRDRAAIDDDPDYVRNAITWTFQVGRVLDVVERDVEPGRQLLLRYEDVCTNLPEASAAFARLLGRDRVGDVAGIAIDRVRTGERANDERAERVWSICGPTAERIGYAFAP